MFNSELSQVKVAWLTLVSFFFSPETKKRTYFSLLVKKALEKVREKKGDIPDSFAIMKTNFVSEWIGTGKRDGVCLAGLTHRWCLPSAGLGNREIASLELSTI